MQYLALCDQVLERACKLLDRHSRVDAVLVIQVDAVSPQALERFLDHFTDMLRPAVQRDRAVDRETELRSNPYLVTKWGECFADELLADIWAVDLGGIEEGHAILDSRADRPDGLFLRGRSVVISGELHAAQADFRHLHGSQCASFHRFSLFALNGLLPLRVRFTGADHRSDCCGRASVQSECQSRCGELHAANVTALTPYD